MSIDDSLLSPAEKPMLEDLIAAAINDARTKADAAAATEMQKMTSRNAAPARVQAALLGWSCKSRSFRLKRLLS